MMKFLILALSFAFVNADCPDFGEWKNWTNQCLWFPMETMKQDIADACEISMNVTESGFADLMPANFQIPEPCGHCSFKFRCRTRERQTGCFSLDGERSTCDEHNQVCELPKAPTVGCRWSLFAEAFKACVHRPDFPEWKRLAFRKFLEVMPEGNCIEKDETCKCCCHPYQPNEDGTECVKVEEKAQCPKFGKFNKWSKCMWFPTNNIVDDFKQHCNVDYKQDLVPALPTPPGFKIPEQCGFCSFRVRCRKRVKTEGCFHVDVDKKACGDEDCENCGQVCTIPYVNGTDCNWTQAMGSVLVDNVKEIAVATKMPYWRRRGLKDMLKNMPYGKCKDINGECKCCCHPYEPNEDGTQCVLSQMCHLE